MKRHLLLLALLLCGSPVVRATSVGFSNTTVTMQDGSGANAGTLTVEFGGFTTGFVPTGQNRDQWASHWVTTGTGYYMGSGVTAEWNAELTAGDNTTLTAGQALYVWARGTAESGLYGDPAWIMPTAAPLGLAATFNFTASTTAVFGQFNPGTAIAATAAVSLAIDQQPVAQSVVVGATVTFTVSASGTGTLTYQWSKDGTPISGATDTTLTLDNVQSADAGSYTVTVSNGSTSSTSDAVSLTVAVASTAAITAQPAGMSATVGSSASLTVTATGEPAPTYQWYLNNVAIPGATGATLPFTNIQPSDAGSYTVIVTNAGGTVTSAAAVVTVTGMATLPKFVTQPVATSAGVGSSATFSASANALPAATYQWYHNNVALSGRTDPTLQLSNVQVADAGNYTVVATNTAGSVTSAVAVLTVNAPPAITIGPVAQTVSEGTNVTFTVTATGTSPFSYEWMKDGVSIVGATGATLTLTAVDLTDTGSYTVTVTNNAGYDISDPVLLTVTDLPILTSQPAAQSVTVGAAASFTVTVTGDGPFSYVWMKDGTAIAGQTDATLSIAQAAITDAGSYTVTVTNNAGSVTSDAALFKVFPTNYAGNYFGTFGSGGYWALSLKADNTGTYIAYLPSRGSAVVVNLTVGADGTFTVTGTEIKPLAANPVSALALANPEAPLPRTAAAAAGYTLTGTIGVDGAISGQLAGLGETFTGAASAASGPAQTSAGFYTATALGTTPGTTYVIVGASGQTVIVTQSASVVDGATGTVVGGQLTATTAGNATVALTLDGSNQTASTTVTPAGGGTPITSTGPSSAVTAEARVVNLSVRSQAGTGSDTLIVGMVINGSGNKSLLLRGTGPALLQQDVADALPDPSMRLLDSAGAQIAANDDWGGSQLMINRFLTVGASVPPGNSKDAALYTVLSAGLYSFHVFPTAGSTASGVVLAELYDADSVQGSATVVNISARTQVGVDDNILILGFVITGNTPKTLLIRGVGPSLVQQGLATGYLVDPQLFLFQGGTYLGMNDDWGGTTALKAAATTVGAGTLSADDSKDAAMLVTLAPGLYSAQVSGVGRTTGVGLVEVFLMP